MSDKDWREGEQSRADAVFPLFHRIGSLICDHPVASVDPGNESRLPPNDRVALRIQVLTAGAVERTREKICIVVADRA